jgi:hypothetical protein
VVVSRLLKGFFWCVMIMVPMLAVMSILDGDILELQPSRAYKSEKSAYAVASCFKEKLSSWRRLKNDGQSYWLARSDMFEVSVIQRYDFKSNENGVGSYVEFRSRNVKSHFYDANLNDVAKACL